jgi:SAM-dependent methyltransferase
MACEHAAIANKKGETQVTWNDGYVSDVIYPTTFNPQQSPAHLGFACLLGGCEPVALDKPFTYMELGCGQGLTSNVLAATHPHARFFACDFNPAHVASARELAEAANLDNIVFLEESFEQLAAGKVEDLPQFDFITMHGVYSWISAKNRRHIVDFIKRYLKPGGIVYANYNAMPGWSAASVLKRVTRLHADFHPDGSAVQIEQARDFIQRLRHTGARFFAVNTSLDPFLNQLADSDTSYRAHEFLNHETGALYHADVAGELAEAKLEYAGAAKAILNFPELHLTPEQQRLLGTIAHGPLRETARDCILNPSMREDMFVRGLRSLSSARLNAWLSRTGLALVRPMLSGTVRLEVMNDDGGLLSELYAAALEALAKRPHRLSELAALPAFAAQPASALLKVAALLIQFGWAAPYFVQNAAIDPAPAHRLNMELARQAETGSEHEVLASPLLGSGTTTGLMQYLTYPFVAQMGKEADAELIARHIASVFDAQNIPFRCHGAVVESPEIRHQEILKTVRAILELRVPLWEQHDAL